MPGSVPRRKKISVAIELYPILNRSRSPNLIDNWETVKPQLCKSWVYLKLGSFFLNLYVVVVLKSRLAAGGWWSLFRACTKDGALGRFSKECKRSTRYSFGRPSIEENHLRRGCIIEMREMSDRWGPIPFLFVDRGAEAWSIIYPLRSGKAGSGARPRFLRRSAAADYSRIACSMRDALRPALRFTWPSIPSNADKSISCCPQKSGLKATPKSQTADNYTSCCIPFGYTQPSLDTTF